MLSCSSLCMPPVASHGPFLVNVYQALQFLSGAQGLSTLHNSIAPLPSCVLPLWVFLEREEPLSLDCLGCFPCVPLKPFPALRLVFALVVWGCMDFFPQELQAAPTCPLDSALILSPLEAPGWLQSFSGLLQPSASMSKHLPCPTVSSAGSFPAVSSLRVAECLFSLYLYCLSLHLAITGT